VSRDVSDPPQSAAIFFLPDGYDLTKPWLMGRQVAGHGFLRAAVAARGEAPVVGYGPPHSSAEVFKAAVAAIDPAAPTDWFPLTNAARRNAAQVCYRPDAALTGEARFRLRHGPGRYCLTGVTHTMSSPGAMAEIAGMLREPLMPWDAVICTSQAALETIRRVHEASADYLRWRHGPQTRIGAPQTPVIPLGVHPGDFAFDEAERRQARAALGLAKDEVAALFVGRLAFAAKAHPQAMYEGLQAAAERTGARVVLIECGWSPNAVIAEAYAKGAADFAPAVRRLAVDAREQPEAYRRCWAACDLFVSLSDNIQETFGLTPVEAMAAGLPVVVSDWNGYRDTVRDGVDGFRIGTWSPAAGFGDPLAEGAEAGSLNYDLYNWGAVSTTSLDAVALVERLSALIADPDLRRRMGEAGRARARETFDWALIYRQYQALWGELNARRLAAAADPDELAWLAAAPRVAPDRLDPFHAFEHYPTQAISAGTVARLTQAASLERYHSLAGHVLWTGARAPERFVAPLWALLARGPATVEEGAGAMGSDLVTAVFVVGTLAKMGLLTLEAPA
jgi:glycosyltransferase involved in cell wall biosynthesis